MYQVIEQKMKMRGNIVWNVRTDEMVGGMMGEEDGIDRQCRWTEEREKDREKEKRRVGEWEELE